MKINKVFVNDLVSTKFSMVGEIIQRMGFLKFDDHHSIQNLNEHYRLLEEISYTVNFLQVEQLITISDHGRSGTPDFNPMPFFKDGTDGHLLYKRLTYINDEVIKRLWNKELKITPLFYEFVNNGYKTAKQKQELINFWLPVVIAIGSPFLVVLISAFVKSCE